MQTEYEIISVDKPAWDVIGPAINAYNEAEAGDDRARPVCFVMRDGEHNVVGGVIAFTYWNWLSIDLMWVREDLRGQGYGSRLLTLAEQAGRDRGAEYAFLDTFSFQAPAFYKARGYEEFGRLDAFPPGHSRFYMKKALL